MNQEQNTYNQQEMPGQMPQGQMMPPPPMPMWQRIMTGGKRIQNIYPNWLSRYPIAVYLFALALISMMYSDYSLSWYYILSGVVAVTVFFLYGSNVVHSMSLNKVRKEKIFERRIFFIAFVPRVIWMFLIYYVFMANYEDAFGFEAADARYYHDLGEFVADLLNNGNLHFYDEISKWSGHDDISDMGYGIYVGFIYWMTGNSIIVVRLLKCIISSFTVLLLYRLAKRNFDESVARVVAVFVALWPNFWYYCGCHLKETEMVFLSVLFVEQAEQMLRSRQFTAWKVIPVLLIAAAIFTFRTPLGLVAVLALVFSVVMSSSRVVNWGKRIIVGVLALSLIAVTMGNRIQEQTQYLVQSVQSGSQKSNMEWRSERQDGANKFAKYAGSAVFAPMIFTLPFPTMASIEGQDVQQLLNGGNFIKNIISCFTIYAMFMLLMSGKWRDHLMPLSFMLGYLVVLALSEFAQSERFHQPVMPFEMMFAAYGLSIAVTKRKCKRWFTYWCGLMFIACIAWNWFKMAGRGLA